MFTINQDKEQFDEVETRPVTEIIESTLKDEEEAKRLYALFEKELKLKDYDRARKVAWYLYFGYGVVVDGLFD